jgi:DNA-binding transcriptional MerR regulator
VAKKRAVVAGYTLAELARAVGETERTLRYWVRRDVLPHPSPRGPSARYDASCATRVRALRALQATGLDLRTIRRRLENADEAELSQLAAGGAAPVPGAPPARAAAVAPAVGAPPHAGGPAWAPGPAPRWQRYQLLPGLELHLREGGGPLLSALAGEIVARYASGAEG